MLLSIILAATMVATAACNPGDPPGNEYMLPARGRAERSPCPYLNALANHGFLSRDGTNITRAQTVEMFDLVFNVDPEITNKMFVAALAGTSSSDPDTLNLVDLDQHGFIEHDVSLSRADEAIGSNFLFNETIWNATLAHFPDPLITTSQMAAARADRVATAGAANPVLAFGAGSVGTSLVESSLLMLTFSNGSTDGGASRQQMDTFFREERLPFDEGFEKPAVRITAERVTLMGQQITFVTKPVKASASAPVTSGSGRHVPVDLLMYSLCAAGFVWSYFNFYL